MFCFVNLFNRLASYPFNIKKIYCRKIIMEVWTSNFEIPNICILTLNYILTVIAFFIYFVTVLIIKKINSNLRPFLINISPSKWGWEQEKRYTNQYLPLPDMENKNKNLLIFELITGCFFCCQYNFESAWPWHSKGE